MLITLQVANTYNIANHYTDDTAIYASDLAFKAVSTKKGIATDRIQFTISKTTIETMSQDFFYLCYDTPVKLLVDGIQIMDGYITKLGHTASNDVVLDISSRITWHMKQFVSPSIESSCQNQVYSLNCGLVKEDYMFHFDGVDIDCLTGFATIDFTSTTVTLGGATATSGGGNNAKFLVEDNWNGAYVIINGIYKSKVVSIVNGKVYFAMSYINKLVTATTIDVYLRCDKTYGVCYRQFSNTQNFWGFANTGRNISTYDIFAATNLEYCGDELAETTLEDCPTDYSIFGVEL